ncbi:hypothetical protein BZL30_7100 [Mycobacterium kansasii]|uniref:Uncharacterized protein n=1 Tax=Mycobacterium kansasii TaxID=1768 RepID=A0A1V3WQH7_MYCKA|nr:hypothetical protein BZL30_7100 [Mycobacterium kansasii]OOK69631.1 hypothetical protein BZL29_6222 [Mycobacterium kansasii]
MRHRKQPLSTAFLDVKKPPVKPSAGDQSDQQLIECHPWIPNPW